MSQLLLSLLLSNAFDEILTTHTRLPAHPRRAVAWLVCTTVTHVGWTLVHQPPPIDVEEILAGMCRMRRGLVGDRQLPGRNVG